MPTVLLFIIHVDTQKWLDRFVVLKQILAIFIRTLSPHSLFRITTKEISKHYSDVIMGAMASLITILTSVYSTVRPADQRKHQSSASLAFVRGIHRRPVNSPHKWPVRRKMFPFDDVIVSQVLTLYPVDSLHKGRVVHIVPHNGPMIHAESVSMSCLLHETSPSKMHVLSFLFGTYGIKPILLQYDWTIWSDAIRFPVSSSPSHI